MTAKLSNSKDEATAVNKSKRPESSESDSSEDTLKLAFTCARAAIDKKAENIKILDLREVSSFTDFFVIMSAMSDRQIHAIADAMCDEMKSQYGRNGQVEGLTEGRWVLLDFGDIVVHVFLDALREYYDLDQFWGHAPKVPLPAELFESHYEN